MIEEVINRDLIDIDEISIVQSIAIGTNVRAEIIVKPDIIYDIPPAPGEPPYKEVAYFPEKNTDIFMAVNPSVNVFPPDLPNNIF